MRPGTKVICVDDSIKAENILAVLNLYPNWIKKGVKYTIRELVDNDGIVDGVLLEEVENPEVYIALLGRVAEPRFATWRFRELEESEEEETVSQTEEIETVLEY